MVGELLLAATVAASGLGNGSASLPHGSSVWGANGRKTGATVWIDSMATASQNHTLPTVTFSLNNVNGDYLVVGISDDSGIVTGVTYNGISLSLAISALESGSGGKAYLYILAHPALGAHNVVVTSSANQLVIVGAITFRNANSVGSLQSYVGNGSAQPSATVLSSSGSIVIDTLLTVHNAVSITAGSGQTEQWNVSLGTGANNRRGGGSTVPGAASKVVGWEIGTLKPCAYVAGSVNP